MTGRSLLILALLVVGGLPARGDVCGLLSAPEIEAAFGTPLPLRPDLNILPADMACIWAGNGRLSVMLLPAENLEAPKDDPSYRILPDIAADAFVVDELGGWSLGATRGDTALKMQADGGAVDAERAKTLLAAALGRVKPPVPATHALPRDGCALATAAQIGAVLGAPVEASPVADGCRYRTAGDTVSIEVKVEPGMADAAMTAFGALGRAEPGIADPLEGLGDAAVQIGPVLMIRRGEDLVTLTFAGVADVPDAARGILAAVSLGASVPPTSGEEADGTPANPLAGVLGDMLAQLASPPGGTEATLPPEIAAVFDHEGRPGGDCPDVAAHDHGDGPTIPLIEGLTLGFSWDWTGDDDRHECLTQLGLPTPSALPVTTSCRMGTNQRATVGPRTLCRVDLDAARSLMSKTGAGMPETVPGVLQFSLSRQTFRELRDTGETWHRFLELPSDSDHGNDDLRGLVQRTGTGTMPVVVNGELRDLPVILVSGDLAHSPFDGVSEAVEMAVLDDPAFPLLLDYAMPDSRFRLKINRITFPVAESMAQQLAQDEQVAVYGIYFAFDESTLLPESVPVLAEIAAVLTAHPGWRLRIDGHTDSVGDDTFNLDLSRRRADAVARALVTRHGIAPARLEHGGFGKSRPRAQNDTAVGRAQNRRVELHRL